VSNACQAPPKSLATRSRGSSPAASGACGLRPVSADGGAGSAPAALWPGGHVTRPARRNCLRGIALGSLESRGQLPKGGHVTRRPHKETTRGATPVSGLDVSRRAGLVSGSRELSCRGRGLRHCLAALRSSDVAPGLGGRPSSGTDPQPRSGWVRAGVAWRFLALPCNGARLLGGRGDPAMQSRKRRSGGRSPGQLAKWSVKSLACNGLAAAKGARPLANSPRTPPVVSRGKTAAASEVLSLQAGRCFYSIAEQPHGSTGGNVWEITQLAHSFGAGGCQGAPCPLAVWRSRSVWGP
jgi:hypothetical protein